MDKKTQNKMQIGAHSCHNIATYLFSKYSEKEQTNAHSKTKKRNKTNKNKQSRHDAQWARMQSKCAKVQFWESI